MRNKLLMIQPLMGMSGAFVTHPPLGLLYASAEIVQNGWEVEILDLRLEGSHWREAITSRLDGSTLLVGLSVMTGRPIANAVEISRLVKSIDAGIKVVWGGPFATFHPEYILRDEEHCDYVVSGYGSKPFSALVERMARGEAPDGIPGVYHRDRDRIVEQPADWSAHEFIDWQKIPYHLIEDYSPYGQLDQEKTIFSIYSAMGCAYQCAFCSSPALYRRIQGRKWVPFPVDEVVDHIEHLVQEYGADYIYFIDDDSFVDIRNVERIIDEIEQRGVRVKLGFRGARVNEIMKMDHAYLDKLSRAGTDILHIGAESGSDRILEVVRKNCTSRDILEINRKLAEHPQIFLFYNFIIGLPTETMEDLKDTAKLWLRLVDEHPKCLIGTPNFFRPLPGTELFELARREWGYEPPGKLMDFVDVEVEGSFRAPWFSKEHNDFCDMMQITSYFIDDKIHKVTAGKSPFYKVLGVLSDLYAPIARFRLKHGYAGFFVERHLYRLASRLMAGMKQAGRKVRKAVC